MKKIYFLLLSAELFLGAYAFAATPEIKLSGRKDRVLASNMRAIVLDAAEAYLNPENTGFIAMAETLESPYASKEGQVEEGGIAVEVKEPEIVTAAVVYDDASILKVIGVSFAKQVRGTLEKGGRSYLQLQGGGLLKSGTSFPATIPDIKDQTFNVTVSGITSRGYTLKMGESTLPVFFNESAGATKDSVQ